MPNYMEIPNEDLVKLIVSVLPYDERIDMETITYGPDWIRFNWNGGCYRVSHSLAVEEIINNIPCTSTEAMLMEALLDLAQWKLVHEYDDPNDKQWHIECETLETERIKAEAELTSAQVELANAETERMTAEAALIETKTAHAGIGPQPSTLKVSCGYCSADFVYTGTIDDAATAMYDRFVDEHSYCRE